MALSPHFFLTGYQRRSLAIAASSEQTAYPAAALGIPRLSTGWRSADGVVSGVNIDFDLGASLPIGAVVIVGMNLTDAATRTLKFSDTALGNSEVLNVTSGNVFDVSLTQLKTFVQPFGRHLIYLPSAEVSARYVRVTATDAANPDGYLRGSYGLVEQGWQPGINFNEQWEEAPTIAGDGDSAVALRGHKLTFHWLSEAEQSQILDLGSLLLTTGRVFVIPRPTAPATWQRTALWAQQEGLPQSVMADKMFSRYSVQTTYREVDE
jgi:hypothetical protein